MRDYFLYYQIRLGEAKRKTVGSGKKVGAATACVASECRQCGFAKKAWACLLRTGGLKQYLFGEEIFIARSAEVYQNQVASHIFYRPNEGAFARQHHAGFLRPNRFAGFQ